MITAQTFTCNGRAAYGVTARYGVTRHVTPYQRAAGAVPGGAVGTNRALVLGMTTEQHLDLLNNAQLALGALGYALTARGVWTLFRAPYVMAEEVIITDGGDVRIRTYEGAPGESKARWTTLAEVAKW